MSLMKLKHDHLTLGAMLVMLVILVGALLINAYDFYARHQWDIEVSQACKAINGTPAWEEMQGERMMIVCKRPRP